MAFLSLIIGFILGAGAIVFAFQNNEVVALTFLGWQFQSSLALVIILAVLTGLLLGIFLTVPSIIRRSFAIMGLERQNRGLHHEAETLRHMNEVAAAEASATTDSTVDLRP